MSERREPTLADVAALVDGVAAGLAELGADVTRQLTDTRKTLMDRMDRLQDAITAIRDDIEVNFGRADLAVQVNDHTRAELRSLREEVHAMERQIRRLQTDLRTLKGEP